jgi:mycothiol synthase
MGSDVKVTVCGLEFFHSARRLLLVNSLGLTEDSIAGNWDGLGLERENIVVATEESKLLGAILARAGEGSVGWIWPPTLTTEVLQEPRRMDLSQELLRGAIGHLTDLKVRLIHALLDPGDAALALFEECGFRAIAEIIQMERAIDPTNANEPLRGRLEMRRATAAAESEFERVVEGTYIDSLDCPELDGIRTVSEVLEGYRGVDESREVRWFVARAHGEAIGCLLLERVAGCGVCSLQYMGVLPRWRGRGFGRELVGWALREAAQWGMEVIHLAVDTRNAPARALYVEFGFREARRKSVLIIAPFSQERR